MCVYVRTSMYECKRVCLREILRELERVCVCVLSCMSVRESLCVYFFN